MLSYRRIQVPKVKVLQVQRAQSNGGRGGGARDEAVPGPGTSAASASSGEDARGGGPQQAVMVAVGDGRGGGRGEGLRRGPSAPETAGAADGERSWTGGNGAAADRFFLVFFSGIGRVERLEGRGKNRWRESYSLFDCSSFSGEGRES